MISRRNASNFVLELLRAVREKGVSTDGWIIDHVCYRTEVLEEFDALKAAISEGASSDLSGVLLSESLVNGRPIATYRFNQPLRVETFLIEAIEIPSPKPGSHYVSGFEHIEVVTTKSFAELKENFQSFEVEDATQKPVNPELILTLPEGRIKFHHLPLSCLIELENDADLFAWLSKTSFLAKLAPWQAMFSGSIPIGVHLDDSDLDVLLYSSSPKSAIDEINHVMKDIGDISWKKRSTSDLEYVGRLAGGSRVIEFFISNVPSVKQNSHRHLLSEYLLLVKEGDGLRAKVKALKMQGASTEEAFCQALGIAGDPYRGLLYPI